LVLRLDENSTFNEIKKKCCKIWSLNDQVYSLYDDAFNNLECCSMEKTGKETININEFFNSHKTYDNTIKDSQVVFYLIEKLKLQRELLESQKRCKKILFK
jgi:hypothetical protein